MIGSRSKISGYRPNIQLKKQEIRYPPSSPFLVLKTFGGANLSAIYERLAKAKKWFSIYGIDPISYYPRILTRRKHLRSQLSTIPTGQQEEIQKRLIFEIQDAFIVECTDLLIAELIHRKGRIQQSMNASRQKMENGLRRTVLESIRSSLKEMVLRSSQDMAEIHSLSVPKVGEETMPRIEHIRRHAKMEENCFPDWLRERAFGIYWGRKRRNLFLEVLTS